MRLCVYVCPLSIDSPPRLRRRVGEDLFVFEVASELQKCNSRCKLHLQLSTHNAASGAPVQASPSAKCVANNNNT